MPKPHHQDFDVLKEALTEVTKDEGEQKKEDAAKELIRKALDLQARMDRAEMTFNSEQKKFDAELRETLDRLHNMAASRPLDEGGES